MKELFLGTRRSGKTEYLINRVSEDCDNGLHSIIVCPNREMCMFLADMARKMGKFIPNPITINEFVNYNRFHLGTTDNEKFYFDELQMSLEVLAGRIPIETVVIDVTHSEIIFKDNTPRWAESEYEEAITRDRLEREYIRFLEAKDGIGHLSVTKYLPVTKYFSSTCLEWLLEHYDITEKGADNETN